MRLLFDQNLAPKLVQVLADIYPNSEHVQNVGLDEADDREVWDFAGTHGFTIVSKDEDFHQLSFLFGPPPKVIWIHMGNSGTPDIERVLRQRVVELDEFKANEQEAFLIINGLSRLPDRLRTP